MVSAATRNLDMRRLRRMIAFAVLTAFTAVLGGCASGLSNLDPTDLLDFLDTKKKLPGERKAAKGALQGRAAGARYCTARCRGAEGPQSLEAARRQPCTGSAGVCACRRPGRRGGRHSGSAADAERRQASRCPPPHHRAAAGRARDACTRASCPARASRTCAIGLGAVPRSVAERQLFALRCAPMESRRIGRAGSPDVSFI